MESIPVKMQAAYQQPTQASGLGADYTETAIFIPSFTVLNFN
jgi:hypothetical protein